MRNEILGPGLQCLFHCFSNTFKVLQFFIRRNWSVTGVTLEIDLQYNLATLQVISEEHKIFSKYELSDVIGLMRKRFHCSFYPTVSKRCECDYISAENEITLARQPSTGRFHNIELWVQSTAIVYLWHTVTNFHLRHKICKTLTICGTM